MRQLICIHGSEVRDTREQYLDYLQTVPYTSYKEPKKRRRDRLGHAFHGQYEYIAPIMPEPMNASYISWKIWFEKLIPYLSADGIVLIGFSCGGIFLAKYLSQHILPTTIHQLHLVAAPFLTMGNTHGLEGEGINDFDLTPELLSTIQSQTDHIYIHHSIDDPVVPYTHSELYKTYLPDAHVHTYTGRGHFRQSAFPEMLGIVGWSAV